MKVSYPNEFQKDTPFLNTSLEYHDFAKKQPVKGEVNNLPVPQYYDPLL